MRTYIQTYNSSTRNLIFGVHFGELCVRMRKMLEVNLSHELVNKTFNFYCIANWPLIAIIFYEKKGPKLRLFLELQTQKHLKLFFLLIIFSNDKILPSFWKYTVSGDINSLNGSLEQGNIPTFTFRSKNIVTCSVIFLENTRFQKHL